MNPVENTKEMLGQALEEFGRRVRAVNPDQWSLSTPCDTWNVREVVNHVVWVQRWVPVLLSGIAPSEEVAARFEGDLLGVDPVATWADAERESAQAAQRTDLDKRIISSFGEMSAREFLRMTTADACVHAWDIARGTGGDETLDPELVQAATDGIRNGRVYGGKAPSEVWPTMFHPPVVGLSDADPQSQLLALVGRDPRKVAAG
jgi:uncharacterized protein (TIGR03086 family)